MTALHRLCVTREQHRPTWPFPKYILSSWETVGFAGQSTYHQQCGGNIYLTGQVSLYILCVGKVYVLTSVSTADVDSAHSYL
jgi:hypothetical protein